MWRRSRRAGESGQAVVEFAVISLVLMALTVGLVDVGRAFYQYNEIAAAAEAAARWAAVQGGTCANKQIAPVESTADWCNGLTTNGTAFWSIKGNYPVQGSASCPTSYDSAGTSSYLLSDSTANGTTTIVGTVLRRLDTTSTSNKVNAGSWLSGLQSNKLRVCIQLSSSFTGSTPSPYQGEIVSVFIYYQFVPVSGLFGKSLKVNMAASSRYVME